MAGVKKTSEKMRSKSNLQKRFDPVGVTGGIKNLQHDPTSKEYEQSFANPLASMGASAEDLSEAFTPDIPTPEEPTIIPIPDEQTSSLEARKRRTRAAGSGRASTILTEGLGG